MSCDQLWIAAGCPTRLVYLCSFSAGCPPPLQMLPGHSALVQDVPWTVCPRAEFSQGTLYPRADCPPQYSRRQAGEQLDLEHQLLLPCTLPQSHESIGNAESVSINKLINPWQTSQSITPLTRSHHAHSKDILPSDTRQGHIKCYQH